MEYIDRDGYRYTLEPDYPIPHVTALVIWDDVTGDGHIITVNRILITRILQLWDTGTPALEDILRVMEDFEREEGRLWR